MGNLKMNKAVEGSALFGRFCVDLTLEIEVKNKEDLEQIVPFLERQGLDCERATEYFETDYINYLYYDAQDEQVGISVDECEESYTVKEFINQVETEVSEGQNKAEFQFKDGMRVVLIDDKTNAEKEGVVLNNQVYNADTLVPVYTMTELLRMKNLNWILRITYMNEVLWERPKIKLTSFQEAIASGKKFRYNKDKRGVFHFSGEIQVIKDWLAIKFTTSEVIEMLLDNEAWEIEG